MVGHAVGQGEGWSNFSSTDLRNGPRHGHEPRAVFDQCHASVQAHSPV